MDWFNDLFIEEAKAALSRPAGNSTGGVSSWNDLTDKPFYKESNQTVIEWDGNTDDMLCVADMFYLVSDEVLIDETIKNGVLTISDGTVSKMSDFWATLEKHGMVTNDYVMAPEGAAIFIRKPGISIQGIPFEQAGVYFDKTDNVYAESFVSRTETTKTIDPEFLPEGYPYKESNQTVIEWDGNVGDLGTAGEYVRVSEQIFSVEELNGATVTMSDGTTVVINDAHASAGQIIAIMQGNMPLISVFPEDMGGVVKKGTYFLQDNPFCSKLAIGTETIHTMAPEFLPAGVGGGGLVFEITESDYTNETSTYTVTKSYDPIYEQLDKGGSVVIKLHDATGIVFIVPQMSMVLAGQGFAIISRGMQSNMTLVFTTGSYH